MKESFAFSENVVGYLVKSEIDQEKIEEILNEIKERLKVVNPICIYMEDESDKGFSMGGFLKALEFHFSHSKDLDKIAIVTDDQFSKMSMEVKDILVPAKVKTFTKNDRMAAMNWVMQ